MRKILTILLSVSMMMTMLSCVSCYAAEKDITVELDGALLTFDVNPEIIDGRTMVPLRKIFEEIGALVKWNGDTQTVSARKSSKTVTLTINTTEMQIDKGDTDESGNPIFETVTLEVPAQIIDGRTLVPCRAISEAFGLDVEWDEANRNVIITSEDNEDESWKENVASINLSDMTFEGNGIEINDNQILITAGGDYTLTGTLADGNITISTKEKVKIRLSGVSITSSENSCIFFENTDKGYITLTDGTENYLVAENSEDGAIYAKDNLEIKGDGSLDISSLLGHAIKASDNLTIENGTINLDAFNDGIHINETFKMTGGNVNITAIGDGIDSESIVIIEGGSINIETNGVPISDSASEKTVPENTQTAENDSSATQNNNRGGMMMAPSIDVEFEKSSKGINAEWMMVVSGGDININSASHCIHSDDEIVVSGGVFNLSSTHEKGISAHGNLTIDGDNTFIDVAKSTEGLESKNVLTINDGIIKVVSTDDALNATGGNSGMMMPGGNGEGGEFTPPEGFERGQRNPADGQTTENGEAQAGKGTRPQRGEFGNINPNFEMPQNGEFTLPEGVMPENGEFAPPEGTMPEMGTGRMPGGFMGGGMGRNMKECLIINGGYIELYAEDDCLDANGNLTINGGTVKAIKPNGSIYGAFGIVDPDGQTTIGENATLIFAAGNGNARSLGLKQNTITVNCETNHEAGDAIKVSDSEGNLVFEYTPDGNYKTVLIASSKIKTGETYKIAIGNETFESEITQQSTTIGTQTVGGMGFDRGQRMQ